MLTKKPRPAELAHHAIQVHLDELLTARGMTLTELSARTGTTMANLSVLKNGRARAVRFTTLTAICRALTCQPGDILTFPQIGDTHPHAAIGRPPPDNAR